MKKKIFGLLLLLTGIFCLQSCDDDDNDHYFWDGPVTANALVTVKPMDTGVYLQLDDSTMLYPTNLQKASYNKEMRALVSLSRPNKADILYADGLQSVYVNWIDTIRTKSMAKDMQGKNEATYGADPLEIVKDWTTVCEDGYLTLRFRTYFSTGNVHRLNLVRGSKPYEVELYHDAAGDSLNGLKPVQVGDGLIAFRLNDLPDTEGKTVELTLKYKSYSGEKNIKFKYRTRN